MVLNVFAAGALGDGLTPQAKLRQDDHH
jgi:hypothetical protein